VSVGDHRCIDLAAALEDAEDMKLTSGASATLSLPLTAEVTFIGFDLAGQGRGIIQF